MQDFWESVLWVRQGVTGGCNVTTNAERPDGEGKTELRKGFRAPNRMTSWGIGVGQVAPGHQEA